MSQAPDTSDLKTDRSRLRRSHERGHYDREAIDAVLAAMPMAHIAYEMDGAPSILPTLQWREGDYVYWHGSSASRALRAMEGRKVCLSVSCLDGYVLARSAMHHSVNFRSVMLFGEAERVHGDHAANSLELMFDAWFPGRWETLRPMNAQEFKATAVMRMPITEGAAKVRTGGPSDDEEDYALPIWAGVLPITITLHPPVDDPDARLEVPQPAHLGDVKIG
ncbi:pyridoxamine 5'-phosphate oxidase family protein [Epibacterium ulvae]|uniref:pyridoxamine 5'-phosphate oxidase family protein n=1 Tax=Epibacterium ulvae TaxID=1156985 RepID=UPI001BFCAD34|nr:pyridoxamine 5'-phosphate oxidase family protein [Epibacterium ulvae]MBT8155007.1 pyridoxamine 5'-phosphate oxidase family protein [Epibacterium ulvae]